MTTSPLPTRKIGKDDVTAIGFGAMGLSAFRSTVAPDEERLKVSFAPLSFIEYLLYHSNLCRYSMSCTLVAAPIGTPRTFTGTPRS